ncbi:hypothetical protein ACOSP7_019235 [Xanthoceras sorbifolium]
MLDLGKMYGGKRGLGYMDNNTNTTPSPGKMTFVKVISLRVQNSRGEALNNLMKKAPTRQLQTQGKVAKALSKHSKTRGKSTKAITNQPKPRQPLKKGHALRKASTSLNKITTKKRGNQVK